MGVLSGLKYYAGYNATVEPSGKFCSYQTSVARALGVGRGRSYAVTVLIGSGMEPSKINVLPVIIMYSYSSVQYIVQLQSLMSSCFVVKNRNVLCSVMFY